MLTTVLFCLFIYLCLNKQNVKKFYDYIYTFHIQRINIHFKMQNTALNILITVDKTCEKVLRLKVEHLLNNKRESRKSSVLNEVI